MPKKILLVDDEESILKALNKDFEQEGYEVMTASSGEEALARLRGNRFDLVVTDLSMPDINGIQVLEVVKKRVPRPVQLFSPAMVI